MGIEREATPIVFPDFKDIEARLRAELPNGDTRLEAYMRSRVFRDLLQADNELLWNSMVADSDRPFVTVAGFHCIHQKRRGRAAAAGLTIIAEADRPGLVVYAPVYEWLSKEQWQPADHPRLNVVLLTGGASVQKLVLAIQQVPAPVVVAWLRSKDVGNAPASSVAVALDRAITGEDGKDPVASKQSRLSPEEVHDLLAKLVQCPGYPRFVYVMHAATSKPEFLEALQSVLHDERLGRLEIALLVRRHKAYVTEHLDALLDGLPEMRRQVLNEALAR